LNDFPRQIGGLAVLAACYRQYKVIRRQFAVSYTFFCLYIYQVKSHESQNFSAEKVKNFVSIQNDEDHYNIALVLHHTSLSIWGLEGWIL